MERHSKKLQIRGAQSLRNEAYIEVPRNDEGCNATQEMDFLPSRQSHLPAEHLEKRFFGAGGCVNHRGLCRLHGLLDNRDQFVWFAHVHTMAAKTQSDHGEVGLDKFAGDNTTPLPIPHHVQNRVVLLQKDHGQSILHGGGQHVHLHGKTAVADDRKHRFVGIEELDRQGGPHPMPAMPPGQNMVPGTLLRKKWDIQRRLLPASRVINVDSSTASSMAFTLRWGRIGEASEWHSGASNQPSSCFFLRQYFSLPAAPGVLSPPFPFISSTSRLRTIFKSPIRFISTRDRDPDRIPWVDVDLDDLLAGRVNQLGTLIFRKNTKAAARSDERALPH